MIVNRVVTEEGLYPTFEVKYLLDSNKVLTKDKNLRPKYKKEFNVKKPPIKISMIFLETKNKDFNAAGWTNRIRYIEGQAKFGMTYKKRIPVENGDLDAAVAQVKEQGFFESNSLYCAEVDWGYSKMTLSLSCKVGHEKSGYVGMELPKKAAAVDMMRAMLPNTEKTVMREKLGKDVFANVKKIGPVNFDRYLGKYKDTLIAIEVMPITNKTTGEVTYVTELSFRKYNFEDANTLRDDMKEYLDGLGINVHEDSLKTAAILEAYLG